MSLQSLSDRTLCGVWGIFLAERSAFELLLQREVGGVLLRILRACCSCAEKVEE
jgi:hypothetical protein